MQDGKPHPLLAQIPLTVSPFITLPTATTLPYTYKTLPPTLAPSQYTPTDTDPTPKFVVSQSGHAAHPSEIITSCHALQAHLQNLQDEAERSLREWEEGIRQRELAEKRRVAPGWLDREEKILEPVRRGAGGGGAKVPGAGGGGGGGEVNLMDSAEDGGLIGRSLTQERAAAGEDLDRAFGGMGIR